MLSSGRLLLTTANVRAPCKVVCALLCILLLPACTRQGGGGGGEHGQALIQPGIQNCSAGTATLHTHGSTVSGADTLQWTNSDSQAYSAVFSSTPFSSSSPYSISPANGGTPGTSSTLTLTQSTVTSCNLTNPPPSCDFSYTLQKPDGSNCPGTFIMHVKG